MMHEIIVDSFAGGGGASTGIELALGRSPDIAVNHDAIALAMHEVNHPATQHLTSDIWSVDPVSVCGGRPVGLLWASPDCKHFSKAKGGKPVEKKIRGLAWVVVHWANPVSPRVIMLENVEEFQTWGPLGADNKPCPLQKGATFKRWVSELQRLGYVVEWCELRASEVSLTDYGYVWNAPTIRKRLYLIARRDGEAIVWPPQTHGNPKSEAVKQGRLKPSRTAAEIIDWSLPCPSIFDSAPEIMAKYGLRAVRPLQKATTTRIAKGVRRYVIDAARPFLVNLTHHGSDRVESVDDPVATVTGAHRGEKALVVPTLIQTGYGERAGQEPRVPGLEKPLGTVVAAGVKHALIEPFIAGVGGRMGQAEPRSVRQPMQTMTAKADSVLVTPFVSAAQQGGSIRPADEPLHTVTASAKDQNQVVAPYLARTAHGDVDASGKKRGQGVHSLEEPHGTVLASNDHAVIAPVLSAYYGEGEGESGRATPVDEPLRTATAENRHAVIAPHLTKFRANSIGSGIDEPMPTVTANSFIKRAGGCAPLGVVAPHLMTMRNSGKPYQGADEPTHTVTSGGAHQNVVAAFMAQNNIDGRTGEGHAGRAVSEPVSTVMHSGSHQGLVAANLLRQFGTGVGSPLDEPARTVMADGQGKTQLSAALLQKYYGSDQDPQLGEPLHTVTTKDRFGVVDAKFDIPPFLPEHAARARQVADLLRSCGLWDEREFVTVEIDGITCVIVDIGMRMLTPRELFRAQGFPDSYIIDRKPDGSPISKTEQVSKCGNSVCPPVAAALVRANFSPREVEPAPQFMEAAE